MTRPGPADLAPVWNARGWRYAAWVMVVGLSALLVHTAANGVTVMALGLAVFVAASLAVLMGMRRLPEALCCLLVAAALFNGAGGAFHWMDGVAWYDEVAHATTGFAGLAAIGYLYALDRVERRATLVRWCIAMGLVLGVGWEVVEGIAGDLERWDTLSDVALDVVGAAFGGIAARRMLGDRPRRLGVA